MSNGTEEVLEQILNKDEEGTRVFPSRIFVRTKGHVAIYDLADIQDTRRQEPAIYSVYNQET